MIHVILVLIVVGVLLYVINSIVPMDAKFKLLVNVVVVIAALFWLCEVFGLLDTGNVGHLRYR